MNEEALRDWYAQLTAADVLAMVGSGQENRQLDFKLLKSDDLGDRSDKTNLAVALSGFANAEGGVVIWGVDARRDPNEGNIDQVVGAPGVKNTRLAYSRLQELASMACSPLPPAVDHRELSAEHGPSFVATYVPGGDSGPHMARLGEDRYYVRASGAFLRMEHFQIADMFGRRARPVLRVAAERLDGSNGEVRVSVTNHGRGPAQALFLLLRANPPFHRNQYGVDGNRNESMPVAFHSGDGWLHATGTDFVLHPTMSVYVGGPWLGHGFGGPMPEECEIDFKVGALGVAPEEGHICVKMNK